jgi:hypothetical protein
MPNSSNKGKGVDKSSAWSPWTWDERNNCYFSSRYGPSGEVEYAYRSPESPQTQQQEQQTPRTPGQNVILSTSSAAPLSSSGGSYSAQAPYSGAARTTPSVGTPSYQSRPAYAPESYYTTTAAASSQSSDSAGPSTSYSSQFVPSPSTSSSSGSFNFYGSSVAPTKSEYESSSKSYDAAEVTSAFRGLNLTSVPSTIHEQGNNKACYLFIVIKSPDSAVGYIDSSGVQTSRQPQTPSNHISRAPNSPDKERLDPRKILIFSFITSVCFDGRKGIVALPIKSRRSSGRLAGFS